MKNKIKYLVLSDIHLGHSINKAEYIVKNLKEYFIEYNKLFKDLDMIILAGDVFDKLLVTSSKDFILANEWLTELLLYCKSNNIILRILEGTPSHDWKQAKVITSIISKLNIDLDYKYIDTLYIENNIKLGISILYIPDEYKHDANDTYKEVLSLLKKHNLSKVDIAIIHGQFHYQLPMVKLINSHTESNYLNIVKYYISVGHIHIPSIYERILAQGSFDRLAHNEEENKGGMLITLYKDKEPEFLFLKNKHSMIFKTYRFKDESIDKILHTLDKELKKYPIKSNIRIITSNDDMLNKSHKELKERYPYYNIKVERDKKENTTYRLVSKEIKIDSFNIDKDNVKELMLKELKNHSLNKIEYDIFNNELDNIIKEIVT